MKPRKGFIPVAGVASLKPIDTIVLLKRGKEQATLDTLPAGGELTPSPFSLEAAQLTAIEIRVKMVYVDGHSKRPCPLPSSHAKQFLQENAIRPG